MQYLRKAACERVQYGDELETFLVDALLALSQSVFAEEVDWALVAEGALTLEDILYRRLRCVWLEPREPMLLLPALTESKIRDTQEIPVARRSITCPIPSPAAIPFGGALTNVLTRQRVAPFRSPR